MRQLSRSRQLVLVGALSVLVGLTGHASAGTTSSSARPAASGSAVPVKSGSAAPVKEPAVKLARTAAKQSPATPLAKVKALRAAKAARLKAARAKAAKARGLGGPAGTRTTTGSRTVALTFDDGPDPKTTPQLLRLLAANHVHATFCLVGTNVRRHPELVRKIVAGGHTLCNHTWNHDLKLGKRPVARIKADLARTNAAIRRAAPKARITYFRAPGGNFTPRSVWVARKLGMASIFWTVDPRDWDHPRGESHAKHRARVISRVQRHTGSGAIVLSHDFAQPDTIAAYRTLLPWLHKRFRMVALPVK